MSTQSRPSGAMGIGLVLAAAAIAMVWWALISQSAPQVTRRHAPTRTPTVATLQAPSVASTANPTMVVVTGVPHATFMAEPNLTEIAVIATLRPQGSETPPTLP